MQIKEEKEGDVLVVTIDDHLDTQTSEQFETKLLSLIAAGERRLLVDCGPLEYVNSAGLKVFLIAAKKLEALGGQLVLCALAPSVAMIFQMIGFHRVMRIASTRLDALESLRGPATA